MEAYRRPFSTRCDFARTNAEAVGVAAQLGLITTEYPPSSEYHARTWRVTAKGLALIEDLSRRV